MSFTGDLEHLSIVDVIQLLHATRKSGTLRVSSPRGESQLVFKDGYILSANHVDNHVRIGNILVERRVITEEQLHLALLDQNTAGPDRKPLIAMLLEQGTIGRDDAYRCLETLIELTIVEIIGWKKGTFTLDVGSCAIDDEYRYFPEKLNQEIYLHTENVLMDALRIYDERMRDRLAAGLPAEEPEEEEIEIDLEIGPTDGEPTPPPSPRAITADDLGLSDLDRIKPLRKERFVPLSDHQRMMRTRHHGAASDLPDAMRQEISDFVDSFPSSPVKLPTPVSVAVFSRDEFLSLCLTVVCKQVGICLLCLTEERDLDAVIRQSILKRSVPVVILDSSSPTRSEAIKSALLKDFPLLEMIEIVPGDPREELQALEGGARTVLPAPDPLNRPESFTEEYKRLINTIPILIRGISRRHGRSLEIGMRNSLLRLKGARNPQEVVETALAHVARLFSRALIFIVRGETLVADRSIGVRDPLDQLSDRLLFTIPFDGESVVKTLISSGGLFYGPCRESAFLDPLYRHLPPPSEQVILLTPVRGMGTTFALIYADHGSMPIRDVPLELVETVMMHAGLLLEYALLRTRLQKNG